MVERFEKTESNLAEREYQLTGELASARNAVLELNRRVDEAELEIVKMSTTPKPSPPLE
jgi:hypothetical protein